MAVPGSVVGVGKLITPGGQQGPKGDAGTAANVPLADITQNGLLRQNTGKTTDFVDGTNNCQPIAPVIWSARLRSFNAIGNPNFEINQRLTGGSNIPSGIFALDRWQWSQNAATAKFYANFGTLLVDLPGTSFRITNQCLAVSVLTQQASFGAEFAGIQQTVEGPVMRELADDVHSISILARTNVAGGIKFGVVLRDNTAARSLAKLCVITVPNVWQLITLPNLPIWPAAGVYGTTPGTVGYLLNISFGAGVAQTVPANDTWQTGNFLGALGQDILSSKPVNSEIDIAFVQHEPGPVYTTLMDKPFTQNLDECLRYYQKSYPYGVLAGSITGRYVGFTVLNGSTAIGNLSFHKTMAKTPALTCYNASTGTINQCYQLTAPSNPYQAASGTISDSGMGSMLNGAANFPTVGAQVGFFYTADTGW